jgi:hypothetical protein
MSTLTTSQRDAIAAKLATMHLPSGLGTRDEACSIAAINLALTGDLTDRIPECMSEAIGHWIIVVQDAMPDEMRNSPEWRALLPLAAGTGRDAEPQRLAIILDWMWAELAEWQPHADAGGYGDVWRAMCAERTSERAALAAKAAAEAAKAAKAAAWAAEAAKAAKAAAWAAEAAEAAKAAAWAAEAAKAAGAAKAAAEAAVWAAEAAEVAAWAAEAAEAAEVAALAAKAAYWQRRDPAALLRRLVTP